MIRGSENVAISQQMRIFDWEHENSPPVVVFDQNAPQDRTMGDFALNVHVRLLRGCNDPCRNDDGYALVMTTGKTIIFNGKINYKWWFNGMSWDLASGND